MAEKEKTPYYFPSKDADVIPWIWQEGGRLRDRKKAPGAPLFR
jgi:hypothetical protein